MAIDFSKNPDHFPHILFIGQNDWANLCNRIARGINVLAGKIVARVWTEAPHPFKYHEDLVGPIGSHAWRAAREIAANCDWIITSGDGELQAFATMLDSLGVTNHKLAATHAGSAYRNRPREYNRIDAEIGFRCRFVGSDSLAYAVSGPPAFLYWPTYDPVVPEDDLIHPGLDSSPSGPVRIVHSPSNRTRKNTSEVILALEKTRADAAKLRAQCLPGWEDDMAPPNVEIEVIDGETIARTIERRAGAHIYVDQLNSGVGGFGAAAVEAMAQGLAIFGNIGSVPDHDVWMAHGVHDAPPIIHVANREELEEEIWFLLRELGHLRSCRDMALDWARTYASPEAVGRYFLTVLGAHS